MVKAAEAIHRVFDGYVLVKGGHFEDCADDLLYGQCGTVWFQGDRVDTKNTHGTGCTLSSAVACGLAAGLSMEQSVQNAKAYVTGALKTGLALGRGCGPLNHCFGL
ncbi:Hydroxymethylpyrimidine/phosphomethylpyrimidine kinase [bioreactor metagenome]|uniref:Hydroxymethylpyrimidine/phosphomethylpyrimidine kinase n=1 Tax=bioreactor metagenome TaxID=1076179 RepID=A0A645EX49_9ZZZZ